MIPIGLYCFYIQLAEIRTFLTMNSYMDSLTVLLGVDGPIKLSNESTKHNNKRFAMNI